MKSALISVGIALGVSALYFHLIGPAVSGAMAKKPTETP